MSFKIMTTSFLHFIKVCYTLSLEVYLEITLRPFFRGCVNFLYVIFILKFSEVDAISFRIFSIPDAQYYHIDDVILQ